MLNANLSSSWSHVATAAALIVGGGLAVFRARQARGLRRWWSATAAALLLLFVVEVSPAHAQVDRLSHGKLIYVPLLAGLVVCVVRLLSASDRASLMWVSLAALASSYVVHVFGPDAVRALGWGTQSVAYQIKVGLKEGTEFAGWLLLALALGLSSAAEHLDHRLGAASKLARWAVGRAGWANYRRVRVSARR